MTLNLTLSGLLIASLSLASFATSAESAERDSRKFDTGHHSRELNDRQGEVRQSRKLESNGYRSWVRDDGAGRRGDNDRPPQADGRHDQRRSASKSVASTDHHRGEDDSSNRRWRDDRAKGSAPRFRTGSDSGRGHHEARPDDRYQAQRYSPDNRYRSGSHESSDHHDRSGSRYSGDAWRYRDSQRQPYRQSYSVVRHDDDYGEHHRRLSSRDYGHSHEHYRHYRHYAPGYRMHHMPDGHHRIWYRDRDYYLYGGAFFLHDPLGYHVVHAPIGARIRVLPHGYISFYLGSYNYYYHSHTYYRWLPETREYVVIEPPEGAERAVLATSEASLGEIYVYPKNGQSEERQDRDRYECHLWAVDQSDYDPGSDDQDAELAGDFRRALTACLEGRGYTVK